jgi:UDP-N-acetylglucosamine--N-acetylmuramyl-(pentapeptide) pyrophosphoryl-undecaprenol N-acetylglucosamine transferase
MLAAKLVGVPTVVHEQNVLPGRANRFLASVVDKLLLTFVESRAHLPKGLVTEWTGMPLRQQVLDVVGMKLPAAKAPFGLMVLGGSMGARILSTVVPEMVRLLPAEMRKRLYVVHQARGEDVARVRAAYAAMKVEAVVESFFGDLPERYRAVHVVVGRSGTGTLLETAALGRAAIYCPHQLADNHQLLNAQVAEKAGAAVVLEQPDFVPQKLLLLVQDLMAHPAKVVAMGKAAQALVLEDATGRVVRALEQAADDDIMKG